MSEFDEIDENIEDEIDTGRDLQDAQLDSYESGAIPSAREQQNLFNWFWRVVRLIDPQKQIKVGNLTRQEIGQHIVSVRDCMKLHQLGTIFHHDTFGKFFAVQAMNTSASSMALHGWLMETSISQKKVREKGNKPSSSSEFAQKKKWRLFSGKKEETPQH